MDTLLQLYNSYLRKDAAQHTSIQRGVLSPKEPALPVMGAQEADDVLVKLVTVLANISINPAVGPALATNTSCVQLVMETLGKQKGATSFLVQVTRSECKANI